MNEQPIESSRIVTQSAQVHVAQARSAPGRRGFTLVEILFSIGILFLLMGLLFVGFNAARNFAKRTASTQTVSTLKTGIALFQNEFGFLPPLVKDDIRGDGPLTGLNSNTQRRSVIVYSVSNSDDLLALQGRPTQRGLRQFSEYSLAFYLMGALDEDVDGFNGPGAYEPARDGTFRTGGRRIDPMVDLNQGNGGLNWIDRDEGRVVLRDRSGTNIRYYRWEAEDTIDETSDLNVPPVVGDPSVNIELRGAKYAIVLAGPNGLFGDEPVSLIQEKLGLPIDPRASASAKAQAQSDNIVGVGP